jgi:hypothetical protein
MLIFPDLWTFCFITCSWCVSWLRCPVRSCRAHRCAHFWYRKPSVCSRTELDICLKFLSFPIPWVGEQPEAIQEQPRAARSSQEQPRSSPARPQDPLGNDRTHSGMTELPHDPLGIWPLACSGSRFLSWVPGSSLCLFYLV